MALEGTEVRRGDRHVMARGFGKPLIGLLAGLAAIAAGGLLAWPLGSTRAGMTVMVLGALAVLAALVAWSRKDERGGEPPVPPATRNGP